MKSLLPFIIACFIFLAVAPLAQAEELEPFLKRFGTAATKADMDEHFHGTVFANGKAYDVDREAILKNVEGQKAAGTVLTVDELTIVSKTESPTNDDKGAVISLVVKVSVTEKLRGATMKIQSEDHHIILRNANGTFRSLYFVVGKQIRKA
jgi:hypothetical protein